MRKDRRAQKPKRSRNSSKEFYYSQFNDGLGDRHVKNRSRKELDRESIEQSIKEHEE